MLTSGTGALATVITCVCAADVSPKKLRAVMLMTSECPLIPARVSAESSSLELVRFLVNSRMGCIASKPELLLTLHVYWRCLPPDPVEADASADRPEQLPIARGSSATIAGMSGVVEVEMVTTEEFVAGQQGRASLTRNLPVITNTLSPGSIVESAFVTTKRVQSSSQKHCSSDDVVPNSTREEQSKRDPAYPARSVATFVLIEIPPPVSTNFADSSAGLGKLEWTRGQVVAIVVGDAVRKKVGSGEGSTLGSVVGEFVGLPVGTAVGI